MCSPHQHFYSDSQPIATIKAVHTGANAAKASSDDASGLEAVVCLAKSARVMLTSNPWVEVGLVNGALGTIESICYRNGGPPDLPLAVMVKFDHYTGPTLLMAQCLSPPLDAPGPTQVYSALDFSSLSS